MKSTFRSAVLTVACVIALATSVSPSHAIAPAAAPTPPRDAKKVVYTNKAGSLNFEVANPEVVAPNKVKDFDAVTTFVVPSVARWVMAYEFRRNAQGSLVFVVLSDGNTALFKYGADGNEQAIKPPTAITSLKKNAGQKNEIALYARGASIMAFVNKVYVDTFTVDLLEEGELAISGDSLNNEEKGEMKFTNFIVRTPPNAPAGAAANPATPASKANIEMTFTGPVGYVPWGRPVGMKDPSQGCNGFDDASPVQQVQISVQVKNVSDKVMKNWYVFVLKPGGAPAFVCYYNYDALRGELQPGQAVNITFAAFIENGESVDYAVAIDKELGASNRLSLKK